jgi:CheY-like chemotaxis protein
MTLDVEMPRMDGLTFLERIMTQHPIPVVICSTLTGNGSDVALAALEKGAVEIITKPKLGAREFFEESRVTICDVVKSAARAALHKRPQRSCPQVISPKLTADAVLAPPPASHAMIQTTEKVVVVGASTGGTEALREFLKPEAIKSQYLYGVPDPALLAPECYELDSALLSRPGNDDIQLDLFLDYASNVALYPKFQEYFRSRRPPTLAVWGNSDPFFLPRGAEAFRRDNPGAEVHLYDAGHFALETHYPEIAGAIRDFLGRVLPVQVRAA